MATWIVPCNLTKYDVKGAFESLDKIDWKQSTNVEAGDIVYIYVSMPEGKIRYKCRANKVNLPVSEINDSKWTVDGTAYVNYGRYMELELLYRFDTVAANLNDLKQRGIGAIMGPLTVNDKVLQYLEQCEKNDKMSIKLKREDLTENIAVIKINKLYREGMSEEALYHATRGVWKRKIESVSVCEYCLSVANSIVVEVYRIDKWYPAGTFPMPTRQLEPEDYVGRIEFVGAVADESIRGKYIGRSVADLYKYGEADPVKVFLKENKPINSINIPMAPASIEQAEGKELVTCGRCSTKFTKAPRCPECGQLIKY